MTIIAVKDGILASDTMVSAKDVVSGNVRKWCVVHRERGGGFFGAAGSLGPAQEAIDIMSGYEGVPVAESMIWVTGDGVVKEKYGEDGWIEFDADFYAIGCGELVARGAMAAGATAEEAVRITMSIVYGCGGECEVAHVADTLTIDEGRN